MATYDPTNWKTGDVITATRLNNMETGIAGALQTSGGTMTVDITMSGNSQLIGNSTSSSMIDISQDVTNINLDEVNTPGQYFLSNSNNNDGAPNAERNYSATYIVISATSSNKNPGAVWKFYIVKSAPPKVYARYFVTNGSNTNSWYLISNTSTDPI